MTYRQALKYLLEQLPMFQRVGAAAYRKDLTNIIRLCDILCNPQRDLKCIHIAGTNGKGSVAHILASILQEQGYKTGLFVSPHYKDYRERIKINGKYISKKFVTKFVDENIEKFKEVDASFFEITTVMAFEYFRKKKVDFAVIETGMGGRLDSTNIITPVLSIITNISFDHQQFLGNTIQKIAGEKAGIIKPGIPVVIGETQKETKQVFVSKAKTLRSKIIFADETIKKKNFKSDLTGSFQSKNLRTALASVKVLQEYGVKITRKTIRQGIKHVIKNTSFTGRWMIIKKKPLTIFDSAHNQGGLKELKKEIQNTNHKTLHFVYGTAGDKDISENLSQLPANALFYFCKANIPRGLDSKQLKQQAEKFGLKGENYSSVKKAFKAAEKNASEKDLIIVAGSIFVIGELL